jgi:NADH:ubiquinone oxidoreductase subunit 5 (subunit L)/multisubunit Na+/H+ antiporter MnhA subunit
MSSDAENVTFRTRNWPLMQCNNHPDVTAADRCAGCAEPFCGDCLVEIHGQKYCGACKVMTLSKELPIPGEGTIPCKEANEAMTYAIIALFCFCFVLGFILGPLAISKAVNAKRLMEADSRLAGWGKANAAIVLGIIATIMTVSNLVSRALSAGQTP